ncbi:MAG: anti-sigma factor, partial [Mesorhizobium sp.]
MSAAEKMSRRDEMETLLPFYLNGSLEGAELEAVEEWLASDPAGQSWLAKVFGRVTAIPSGVAWAAAAALLALVVAQSFERPGGKGNDFEIAGAQDDLANLPFALVKFKPDARMSDIAAFLGQNGLKIAGGPTA